MLGSFVPLCRMLRLPQSAPASFRTKHTDGRTAGVCNLALTCRAHVFANMVQTGVVHCGLEKHFDNIEGNGGLLTGTLLQQRLDEHHEILLLKQDRAMSVAEQAASTAAESV